MPPSPYSGYLVETLVTLVAVCVLAFLVLWGARRLGFGRASGPIEMWGHLPLDARRAIYLVRVGERVYVVGVGDGVLTKLGDLSTTDLSGPLQPGKGAFATILSRAMGDVAPAAPPSPENAAPPQAQNPPGPAPARPDASRKSVEP